MRFVTLSSEIFARFFSIVSVTSPTIAGSLVTLAFENDTGGIIPSENHHVGSRLLMRWAAVFLLWEVL